jgi:hypothetical protein
MPKTFLQKFSDAPAPHVVRDLPPRIFETWIKPSPKYGGAMLISCPRDIDAMMQQAGKGELTTAADIAKRLAAKHKADITCPMTPASLSTSPPARPMSGAPVVPRTSRHFGARSKATVR